MKKTTFILSVLIITALVSCRSISGLKAFSKCSFDLKKIEDIRIDDIDVSNIKSFSDFKLKDAARLAKAFLNKKLPLTLTFVVNIANNSKKVAMLEKMDYIVAVDSIDVLSGNIENPIEVAPKTSALYYIKSDINVINLFNKAELKDNIKLVLNLISSENIYKEMELKVKPYIKIGKQFIAAPNMITVKHKGQ